MKTRNKMATVKMAAMKMAAMKMALMLCIVAALIGCSDGGGGGGGKDYKVGDTGPGGGIIFYASKTGFTMTDNNQLCHYLEAAPSDQSTTLMWVSISHRYTDITGIETAIGTGRKNTALILAIDADAPAAKACKDTGGSKTDWFLPSKDELNELYNNRASVGNLETSTDSYYWSSSHPPTNYAWDQCFSNGYQDFNEKILTRLVRAVRAF